MANTVNKTVILAGPRRVVVHLYLESDGVAGELVNYPVFDPTIDCVPLAVKGESLILTGFSNEQSGFDATLSFEAVAPGVNYPLWVFTPFGRGKQNFNCFGGLPDNSGLDATGKVLMSTNGFTAAGDRGAFVLFFTRKGA